MAGLGLDRARLKELDILDLLLKGYKTPRLISVSEGNVIIDTRLQLRMDDNVEVVLHIHKVQKKEFSYRFSLRKFH